MEVGATMDRVLRLTSVKYYPHDYQPQVLITLSNDEVVYFCLELSLLSMELCNALRVPAIGVGSVDQVILLRRNTSKQPKRGTPQKHVRSRDNIIAMLLSVRELEYMISFLLRYYRDGVVSADHIDLEVEGLDASEQGVFLTIKVPLISPPVPLPEARRRLGLPEIS
jgi:hypothetical protein